MSLRRGGTPRCTCTSRANPPKSTKREWRARTGKDWPGGGAIRPRGVARFAPGGWGDLAHPPGASRLPVLGAALRDSLGLIGTPRNTTGQSTLRCPAQREITNAGELLRSVCGDGGRASSRRRPGRRGPCKRWRVRGLQPGRRGGSRTRCTRSPHCPQRGCWQL